MTAAKPDAGWLTQITATIQSVDIEWQPGGREAVETWLSEHECPSRAEHDRRHGSLAESGVAFGGPVGGVLQFIIVPTTVGTFVHAQCGACGERLDDLTNLTEMF